ncbi:hypothetical protein ARMGADRAFT_1159535 [Armillaria gallica]|uniref:Uncharacterized protein n=1 Tax=Armillaria gallica TaxID=47427 RepID=A0A2H3EJ60_ARMGA|nr:hypothetical protein ARMGADRAFT_1159535 [Armillaria gallica]
MLPQFGECVAFKLDPVAFLKALDDPEVTQACEALQSDKNMFPLLSFPLPGVEYISGNMTLVARGLPNDVPDAFITSDVSVSVLPNTSNPLLRPPLQPTTPLPWPDCYHPTQAMTRCRMRNDAVIVSHWPDPKYRLTGWDQTLLAQTYFSEDGEREVISTDQPGDCQASPITRPVPSEPDAESRYCPSVSEAGSGYAPSVSVVRSRCSDAGSQNFDLASSKGEARLTPAIDLYDDEVASISPSDPIWSHPIFGKRPPDTMPVIILLDNLESIKSEDINDPWTFFQELEALKRIEEDFKERMKIKTQTAIQRARQKDEALHARIHSKMPKRVSMQEEAAEPITSDPVLSEVDAMKKSKQDIINVSKRKIELTLNGDGKGTMNSALSSGLTMALRPRRKQIRLVLCGGTVQCRF